jgi:hypothetical protein
MFQKQPDCVPLNFQWPNDSHLEKIEAFAFAGTTLTEHLFTLPRKFHSSSISPTRESDTTFSLPDGVSESGNSAFFQSSITHLLLPDSLLAFEYAAFANPISLKSVIFGSHAKLSRISDFAFFCSVLTQSEIPFQVTEIGVAAFLVCRNLKTITFPKDGMLEKIDVLAFAYTGLFSLLIESTNLRNISDMEFSNCKSLKHVMLGSPIEL